MAQSVSVATKTSVETIQSALYATGTTVASESFILFTCDGHKLSCEYFNLVNMGQTKASLNTRLKEHLLHLQYL